MQRVDVARFGERRLSRLSGGERKRVFLASALAQQPRVLLLDEPTSSLDMQHQVRFFRLLSRLTIEGTAVVVVIHDLNMAAQFCTRLVLLSSGRIHSQGEPGRVITTERLRSVYGPDLDVFDHPAGDRPIVLPRERSAGEEP